MTSRWSDDTLEQARLEGDPDADRIIAAILNPPAGNSGRRSPTNHPDKADYVSAAGRA